MKKIYTVRELLSFFPEGEWALPAFNVFNMEFVQAVVAGAEAESSPVVLMLGDPVLDIIGLDMIIDICFSAAGRAVVPIAVALDHGKNEARLQRCIERGVSVMFDGSSLPLDENIRMTRLWGDRAHKAGLSIEAELGSLGSEFDSDDETNGAGLASVDDCEYFLSQVKVDLLAVAIGNQHGPYKTEPKIDIDRLDSIHRAVQGIPLVLHGTSGIPADTVRNCIARGVRKVNYGYDLKYAYASAMRDIMNSDPLPYQPPKYIKPGREAIVDIVRKRINEVGSAGLVQKIV